MNCSPAERDLRADVYTPLGVMAGLSSSGWWAWGGPAVYLSWLDPVIAILVAALILKTTWDLTRESAATYPTSVSPRGTSAG
jgi:divalent metal cation (Fe/Co/Zn/Cd) transporter